MNITSECSAVAELIVEVAPPVACAAGTYTANPYFCGPLFWLNANPGYKNMVKFATEQGCDVVVEVGPKYFKIVLKDTKRGIAKAKRTYQTINTPLGMMWLMRYLSGY